MDSNTAQKPASPAGRYFLYAIGEIALVVIGILIALQINNWSQSIKDRKTESTYLRELKKDLVGDTTKLNNVFLGIESHIQAAEEILAFMEQGKFTDTLSMLRNMLTAGFMYFFDPNMSTYNELINSGNLKLLREKDLKDKLDRYVAYIQQIEERYEWNKQKVWFGYGNYIRDNYLDGRLFAGVYVGDSTNIQKYPVDWSQLKNDRQLARMLTQVIAGGFAERRWQLSTMRRVEEIIQHIEGLVEEH